MKPSDRFPMCIRRNLAQATILLSVALLLGASGMAMASVLNSKHNLSSSGPGPVKAVNETQVCVFCHTPHGGDQTAGAPLWNRLQSTVSHYTPYLSSSMDSTQPPGEPGGSSKVCLSCHDGTLAIGTVGNLNGKKANINMSGTGPGGVMPDQHDFVIPDISKPGQDITVSLAGTGYTRNLGVDMSNDHPISIAYNTALYNYDGEMRPPPVIINSTTVVGNRSPGVKPIFPLENDQMQCPTCHDPHLSTNTSPKFLRGLRLQGQTTAPLGAFYDPSRDIMCLACHDNDKSVGMWSNSAHANLSVADETYTNEFADIREFPRNTQVWQASCLNCHDNHTVQGARYLLREGTDSTSIPKGVGNSALEETCYQCHSDSATSVLSQTFPPNTTPDIKSDFTLSAFYMPISAEPETHNVGGSFNDSSGGAGHIATGTTGTCLAGNQCAKDLVESEALLGKISAGGVMSNRHAECTDCHNPHRTTKNRLFYDATPSDTTAGTHKHNIANGDTLAHSNIASGSLRGTFGVEPNYTSSEFGPLGIPSNFDVKRGDPGLSTNTDINKLITYVTREYQVCLKCHSNYAYDTPDVLDAAYNPGGTHTNTNGFHRYLNTAMETQAPSTHMGAPASTSDSGAYSPTFSANNYRSWHPVMNNTGRTVATRGNASPDLWRAPWNGADIDGAINPIVAAVGNQTMYCSDCHGSYNIPPNGVVPDGNGSAGAWSEDGKPWGPHGSSQSFILKGPWDTTAPININPDVLCFRCHEATQYADASGAAPTMTSGFSAAGNDALNVPMTNLHQRHAYYTSTAGRTAYPSSAWPASGAADNSYRCTMCHTGTAHGWKNKDFLVNLNDIGPELNKADASDIYGGALGGEIPISGGSCPPGTGGTLCPNEAVTKGTRVPIAMASVLGGGYTNGPYYQEALLYINSFKPSGNWTKADCSGCH